MLPPTRLCSLANITKLYIKGYTQLGAYFSFVSLACGQPSSDSYNFPQCVEFHQLRWFCGISCYPTGTLLSCHRNAAELNLPFQGERAELQSPIHIFSLAICHLSNWNKAKSSSEEKAWPFTCCLSEEGETVSSCPCFFPFYIQHVGFSSHYLFSSLNGCCLHSCK